MTPSMIFSWARSAGIKTIRLGIFQLRTTGGMTEEVITLDELEAFADTLHRKAQMVEGAAMMFTSKTMTRDEWDRTYLNADPNDVDCAFCRALPTCPAARRKVEETVGADFEVITSIDTSDLVDARRTTPDDRLSSGMKVCDFLEDWIKATRSEVERRLLAGVPVDGFGLDTGRAGNRTFIDEQEAEDILRKQFHLSLKEVFSFKLKTVTQIEKLTKAGVDGKPVLGPRQWNKLQTLVTRTDGKPSVKPIDKIKNPYVAPVFTGDDFAPVDDGCDIA